MNKLPNMLDADLRGKICLVRMDHNVVKKGKIKDSMRIDATIPTLLHIYKQGGLPILMTHVGRPYDKKTGEYTINEADAVQPIVKYLDAKLQLKGYVPELVAEGNQGIKDFSPMIEAVRTLKDGEFDYLYLPNTRWFNGEEAKDESADALAKQLAGFAEVYINDAFGSWQAHATTYGITKYLPSYAGLLMQKEVENLQAVFNPQRPLIAVVAGSKFDTKIGPLSSLITIADYLVLGGVIYNAYLCHKYGVRIEGVAEEDVLAAGKFIADCGEQARKIVELPYIVENQGIEARTEHSWKVHNVADLKPGMQLGYVLDVAPRTFELEEIKALFGNAGCVFVNAVMGYTALFPEGSMAMYRLIDSCSKAKKLFGGGDTIQDFKEYLPGTFAKAQNDSSYYFFTGGGAILDAIQQGSAFGMKPIQALLNQ